MLVPRDERVTEDLICSRWQGLRLSSTFLENEGLSTSSIMEVWTHVWKKGMYVNTKFVGKVKSSSSVILSGRDGLYLIPSRILPNF